MQHHQHIGVAVYLDGVTPEVDGAILRLGEGDLVFPDDPEARAALALDMIDCLNEIRTDALRAAVTRQGEWDASRRAPFAPDPIDLALERALAEKAASEDISPAEVRHERLTEGVAS